MMMCVVDDDMPVCDVLFGSCVFVGVIVVVVTTVVIITDDIVAVDCCLTHVL